MTMHSDPAKPTWRGRPLEALLIDLDGTLLDTVDDIAAALNLALAEQGLASLSTMQVRELIGRGVPALITRALALLKVADAGLQAALTARFYVHYEAVLQESSARLYPGVADGVAKLRALGLKLAVVTNKRKDFSVQLLKQRALHSFFDVVVGGDCCARRKPDPQPLEFACDQLQVPHSHALMVGDSETDVRAARAAGLPVICVPYGYNEGRDPSHLACDALTESLSDLADLLSESIVPHH